MKQTILQLFVFIFVAFGGNHAAAQNVHVSAQIKGLKRDSMMIMSFKEMPEVRYVKVKNERFEFTDSLTEPVYIQIMGQGKLDLLLQPGSDIKLEGSVPLSNDITVSGSRSDSLMKAYLSADHLLVDSWYKTKSDFDSLKRIHQNVDSQKLEQVMYEKLYTRVALLKQYVSNYRTEPAAALIINFCMLQNVLKPADYKEMYAMLSPEVKETVYGQSVKSHAEEDKPKPVKKVRMKGAK